MAGPFEEKWIKFREQVLCQFKDDNPEHAHYLRDMRKSFYAGMISYRNLLLRVGLSSEGHKKLILDVEADAQAFYAEQEQVCREAGYDVEALKAVVQAQKRKDVQ